MAFDRSEFTPDAGLSIPTPPAIEDEDRPRFWIDLAQTVIISLVLFLVINLVSARIRVESVSMLNTLRPGYAVLVNRIAYQWSEPQIGDIVVFDPPFTSVEPYIKRVIGLPGSQVRVADGKVYVNGMMIDEPYLNSETTPDGVWQVPDGYLFVMGDNRSNSSDSRAWGPVPLANVIGQALVVYWPPESWALLDSPLDTAVAAPNLPPVTQTPYPEPQNQEVVPPAGQPTEAPPLPGLYPAP